MAPRQGASEPAVEPSGTQQSTVHTGQMSPAPPETTAPAERTPKVTIFNAKGHAQRLQEETAELRAELDELKGWIRDNGIDSAMDALRVEKESKARIREAEDAAEQKLHEKEAALDSRLAELQKEVATAQLAVRDVEVQAVTKRNELASVLKDLIEVRTRAEFQDLALFDFDTPRRELCAGQGEARCGQARVQRDGPTEECRSDRLRLHIQQLRCPGQEVPRQHGEAPSRRVQL